MNKLFDFDDGVKEFEVNGRSKLRFNPSDPNVYSRVLQGHEKLLAIEKEMEEKARKIPAAPADAIPEQICDVGKAVLDLFAEMDFRIKEVLAWIFPGNDFEEIFDGVNLMAVAGNGERVITNFIEALFPVFQAGVESYADGKVQRALSDSNESKKDTSEK